MIARLMVAIVMAVLLLQLPALAYKNVDYTQANVGPTPQPLYDVNVDRTNDGPDAYDYAVELEGSEDITKIYFVDFGSHPWGQSGGRTWIHWQNYSGSVIYTDGQIHVGWSTSDHTCKIADEYWTDSAGNRITGSKVSDITPDYVFQAPGGLNLIWENLYSSPIRISNLSYAVFDSPVPLDSLNAQNVSLAAVLQPMGGDFLVIPGVPITTTSSVAEGKWVVLRYEVSTSGSQIPTLSEWGMIIFVVLLAGWMTFVVVRRWRAARATAA